jgi:hypothetical protein
MVGMIHKENFSNTMQAYTNVSIPQYFIFLNWDFDLDFRSFEIKKIYSHLKNVN